MWTRTLISVVLLTVLGWTTILVAQTPAPQAAPAAGDIDKLVAPIALYPDPLIAQVLLCSQDPSAVKKMDGWLKGHANLKGTEAQSAAQKEGFEASFVALVSFPQVIDMMAKQLDWTTALGQAFIANKKEVFASIQRLRRQAKAAGNLESTPQQEVTVEKSASGQEVIVIQPANPQIVYVPQYNPQAVYAPPPPSSGGRNLAVAAVGFTTGVIVAEAFDDDDDHGWGYHGGISEEGWDEYEDHREDMSSQRQKAASENQAARQETGTANQAARQETATGNQAARQAQQDQNQAARQEGQTANQAARQEAQVQGQANRETNQANRQSSASAAQASRAQKPAAKPSATGGYGNANQTRAASAQGQKSMGGRSGGGSGGRGGGGGGGGRR